MKKNIKIYCVPSVHWDREWYRPFSEFQFHLVELMDMVIELLQDGSLSFFHTDGYSALIEDYLEKRPEKIKEIKKLASSGRLEIGPFYILSDMFIPSGEAFIRNLETGIKTAYKYGMRKAGIPYAPDAFGHSADIPKILKHLGFDAYYFCRGLGNHLKKPATEFIWKSDDGSEILALAGIIDVFDPPFDVKGKWFCGAYGLGMELPEKNSEFRKRMELITHHAEPFMNGDSLLMICGCDHLLPQKHLKKIIGNFNSGKEKIRCMESTLRNYAENFRKIPGKKPEHAEGELMDGRFLNVLNGTASSRIYLKKMNFDAQNLLEGYLEPWAAFASLCGNFKYDKFIEDAWKLLLKNQAHDSICGCSVDSVHREMEQRYREIFQSASRLFERAAKICMGDNSPRMIFPNEYPGIFKVGIFTAVPWKTSRPFETEITHPSEIDLGNYIFCDSVTGKKINFEISHTAKPFSSSGPFIPSGNGDNKLLSVTGIIIDSANLPAYGYKLFEFRKRKKAVAGKISEGPVILKNEFLTVKIGRHGEISVKSNDGAFDKTFNRLLYFEDNADIGDEYFFIAQDDDRSITNSSGKAEVRWLIKLDFVQRAEINISLNCPLFYDEKNKKRGSEKTLLKIRNVLTLAKGSRRIDVVTEFDNNCCDHRLRVCFDMPWKVKSYFGQTQFGKLRHSIDLPENSEKWREKPTSARRNFGWLSFCGGGGKTGFAVMPKGLHEHAVENKTLKLTLLRSVGILGKSSGPGIPTPDAQCQGLQRCEYSLIFFDCKSADENYIWREAQSYARAPAAVICSAVCGKDAVERSFFEFKSEKIILSSITKGKAERELKGRFYNASGNKASGTIKAFMKKINIKSKELVSLSFVP